MLRKLFVVLFLPLALTACGGGGGGGGNPNVSAGGDEGSVDGTTGIVTPKKITTTTYRGSVLTGSSYYVVTGLTAAANYDIHLSNITDDITLSSSSSSLFTGSYCSSDRAGTLSEACGAQATADGEIFFEVGGSAIATVDANYDINVMAAAGANQGTVAAPLDITAAVPQQGVVADTGSSYYVVTGLTPGQNYDVSLSGMIYKASLRTYPHQDFSTPPTAAAAACSSDNPEWQDETCTQVANFEGNVYIQVDDISTGTNQAGSHFSLNVSAGTGTASYFEGYSTAPITLSATPYSSVAYGYSSYYQVTGLTPGSLYEVHFKNASADGTALDVTAGSDSGGGTCFKGVTNSTSGNYDKWCVTTATDNGNLFIEIGAAFDIATVFDLDITPAPIGEGIEATPLTITMPYNGQVDGQGPASASYYVVSGLSANWNYEVLESNQTKPITTTTGTSFATLGSSTTGTTNGAGELYIKVSGDLTGGDGAWFTLDITEANNREGSTATPLNISSATEITPHNGQVDSGSSYYVMTGLTAGKNYMTHLNSIMTGTGSEVLSGSSISVYSDNSFLPASLLCTSNLLFTSNEYHCLAPASGTNELFIKIIASWDFTGSSYKLWTVAAEHNSQGEVALPLDIDQSLVISGGGGPIVYNAEVSTYGNATSYYKVATSDTASYTVLLSNLNGDVDLSVSNALTGSTDTCLSKHKQLLDESCIITGNGGGSELVITVTSIDPVQHWDGASFDITVTPGATTPVAEGTSVAPVTILAANLPYTGQTADAALNYYVVTGLSSATNYEISSANNVSGLSTTVYSDAFLTQLCSARAVAVNHSSSERIACQATPNASGEFYMTVAGDGALVSNDSFELSVVLAPVAENSAAAPLEIAGTGTRASQANGPANSYYHVTGLTIGNDYIAHVSNNTETVNLTVYSDAGFSSSLCNTGVATTQCQFTSATGDAYILADAYVSAAYSGSFFDLSIAPAPVPDGTLASPTPITAGVVYNAQQGGFLNDSYYQVTGLVAHSTHRVLITNMTANTSIYLYGQSSMLYKACVTTLGDVPTGCSIAANASGEIFIRADNMDITGSNFDIFVTP